MTDSPLLHLTPSTDPDQLLVDEAGTIFIRVSPAQNPTYADSLKILVPEDLFRHGPDASCTSCHWHQRYEPLPEEASQDSGHYPQITFLPNDGPLSSLISEPFDVILTGVVGDESGPAVVSVTAGVRPGSTGPFSQEHHTLTFEKATAMLYLRNFASYDHARTPKSSTPSTKTSPTSPHLPVTQFAKGSPIYLTWESNATKTTLYFNGTSVPLTEATTYCLEHGLAADTTLFLVSTLDVDSEATQTRYAALTVTISDPTLADAKIEGSLDVGGQSTLAGITMRGDLVTPGVVSAGQIHADQIKVGGMNISSGGIDGDVTFRGSVRFQNTVHFAGEVHFQSENTIFENRIVISTPGSDNWYIYPSNGDLIIQGGSGGSAQYRLTSDGSLRVNVANSVDTEFMKNADVFKLTAVVGIPSNNTLAFNKGDYQQQAMWIRYTDYPDWCQVKIEKF